MEGRRSHVWRSSIPLPATKLTWPSYNRYLAVAARVVRRSLKEDKRLQAERRGEMDLRFAKWQVSSKLTVQSERLGNDG
jgi:Mitochondrial ATP synthase epsilon chain